MRNSSRGGARRRSRSSSSRPSGCPNMNGNWMAGTPATLAFINFFSACGVFHRRNNCKKKRDQFFPYHGFGFTTAKLYLYESQNQSEIFHILIPNFKHDLVQF
jgi:hypothetical protein